MLRKNNGLATIKENLFALWFAKTLGLISPKSNNKKVIIMTWKKNSILESLGNSIAIEVRYADNITIAIFIKLLAIRIVAKSIFGSFNNFSASIFYLFFSISCNSVGLSEKNAVSEPETNAEKIIRRVINIKQNKTSAEKNWISIPSRIDNKFKMGASSKLKNY